MYTPMTFFAPQGGSIVTEGLVLYFDANNIASYPGSGTTVTDLSVGANVGTMINSLPVNTDSGVKYWDWGDSNNTRRIEVPHSSNFNMNTAITMEVWFWLPNLLASRDGEQHYFMKRKDATSHSAAGYQFAMRSRPEGTPGKTLTCWVATEAAGNAFNFSPYSAWTTAGVWQQFVCTFNNTDDLWQQYWNGQNISTSTAKTVNFSTATSGVLYLGCHTPGTFGQPKGRISIFRIYKDKQLSAAEVLQNFNADKSIFGL